MSHDILYHLSGLEAIWVVVALVGLVLTSYNCTQAWRDYRHILEHGIQNGRRIVGRTAAWTEVTRVVVQVIFLGIGLGAGTIPDPPAAVHVPLNVQIVQFVVRWGLITASALITYQSYQLRRMRHKINAPIEPDPGQEAILHAVEKLADYADEAEARRVEGPNPDADVKREEH